MGGRPQAASLVQGLRPRNAPLYTMPRWRRGAGAVSMPPVAHPPRVAKQPAATPAVPSPVSALTPSRAVFTISPNATVGAGLVPAHLWGTVPGSAASFSGQPQNPGRTHLAYTLTVHYVYLDKSMFPRYIAVHKPESSQGEQEFAPLPTRMAGQCAGPCHAEGETMVKSHDKKTPEANPHNTPAPKPGPNEQEPARGKTASDEEVRRHYNDSIKKNRRLLELLAQ